MDGGAGMATRTGQWPTPLLTAAAAVVGLLVTAVIVVTPDLVFGYHNPELHLVLDSVDGCVGLLVATLMYGRYRRSHRLQDLLMSEGLFLLVLAGIGLTLVLEVVGDVGPATITVWLPQLLRVVAALFVLAAALVGNRPAGAGWHRWASLVPWGIIGLAFLVLWRERDRLPEALSSATTAPANTVLVTGHPLLLAGLTTSATAFAVASVAFTRQAVARPHDELFRWLGPALALLAVARVDYVLYPSIYSDWLYVGDIFRTAGYLVLLVGAAREISQYWTAQTRAAVLDDRRRLARELHDGVIQELAYIRAEAHGIPDDKGTSEGVAQRIVGSCDRALDEARAAVDALGRSEDEPLGFTLHRAARQVAERFGAHLEVDLDDSVTATAEQRHALVRITREALANALRHGAAQRVTLRVERTETGRRLVVHDDGAGFDLEAVAERSTGYGLTSMRERAQALPGQFTLASRVGVGTTVEVAW